MYSFGSQMGRSYRDSRFWSTKRTLDSGWDYLKLEWIPQWAFSSWLLRWKVGRILIAEECESLAWNRCRRRKRGPLSIPCEGGVSAGLQKKKEGRGKLEADPGSRCYQLFSFHYFWYFLDSLIENISETRLRIYHQSCTPLEACGGWIMTLQKYPSLTSLNLWIVTLHGKSYFADDVIKSRPLRWRDDPGLSAWTTNIISSILTEGDREIWP